MHLDRFSLFIIIILNVGIESVMSISGCTVTLINSASVRRMVLCANPNTPMEVFPEGLPETTDMLIISYQNITSINEHDLYQISNMTRLLLTFSNLERIHKNSFKYLTNLVVLDLSGNRLSLSKQSLPADLFNNLPDLQYLRLTNNPLGFVPDLFFKPMSLNLRKLYLDKCKSPPLTISPRAFKGLRNLEELDLRDSGLVGLLHPMEADLREMKLLKKFLITGNKLLCDCKLRWLYFYFIQIQDLVSTSVEGDLVSYCSAPHKLANRRFPSKDERDQLRYTDFICPSACSIIGQREIVSDTGNSINLTCQCSTDPIQRPSWTKNGHIVEETPNKYAIFHEGKETFQSTLNILSLQPVDSGNWTCKVEVDIVQRFSLKVKSRPLLSSPISVNVYIFVGLGSSVLLILLIVIVIVLFCRREALCQFRHQHPMVICGYETNIRKSSLVDGDIQYRYNQQDGRFNTSFYENTIPFDTSLSHYGGSNHIFLEDLPSDKNFVSIPLDLKSTLPKSNNEKMLNTYCGCHYNSDDDREGEMMHSTYSYRSRSLRPINKGISGQNPRGILTNDDNILPVKLKTTGEIEKLIPNRKQCPFHGSSGTLTRIPGHKPCPVHGSTATLPSRLSSKRVEHRFGCPKHNKDNISVKSLKLDSTSEDLVKPHRCKSVSKISSNNEVSPENKEVHCPVGYRPCPLHGDILAAINENIFEPPSNNTVAKSNNIVHKRTHSKGLKEKSLNIPAIGCDRSSKRLKETSRNRGDHYQGSSVSISNTLTSPVQSSLSSSPLLTSDVHGTLV